MAVDDSVHSNDEASEASCASCDAPSCCEKESIIEAFLYMSLGGVQACNDQGGPCPALGYSSQLSAPPLPVSCMSEADAASPLVAVASADAGAGSLPQMTASTLLVTTSADAAAGSVAAKVAHPLGLRVPP